MVRWALGGETGLERLLADLLLLATVEGSDAPMEPVPLHEVVRAEAARARRLPVTVAEPLPEVVVPGRRMQLERVVANLLDNASRHARSTVLIGQVFDGDDVVLTVDDDGLGIPEADRERVFDRFTRLDEGRARVEGGAGLGLALVRTIVQRHGGSVTAAPSRLGGAHLHTRLRRTHSLQRSPRKLAGRRCRRAMPQAAGHPHTNAMESTNEPRREACRDRPARPMDPRAVLPRHIARATSYRTPGPARCRQLGRYETEPGRTIHSTSWPVTLAIKSKSWS